MTQQPHEHQKFFRFLRRLRAEGRTNMYGAIPYLMSSFALDRESAFRIVCSWIDQQSESGIAEEPSRPRKPPRPRAA
jgi:hypothetical protein